MAVLLTVLGIILYLGIGLTFVGFAAKKDESIASDLMPVVLAWPLVLIVVIIGAFAGTFLYLGDRIATWVDKPREVKPKKIRIDETSIQKEAEQELDEFLAQEEPNSSIR